MDYREYLTTHKANLTLLTKQKETAELNVETLVEDLKYLEESRTTMNNVQLATQITLSEYIESVVAKALQVVFGDSFGFKVEYSIKRNQSEARLYIVEQGELFDPNDECGVGALDVAGTALRMALWVLPDERTQNVMILDEPGTAVSKDLLPKFGQMLKECSELLQLQIIMISHDDVLIDVADKAFRVTKNGKISYVEAL